MYAHSKQSRHFTWVTWRSYRYCCWCYCKTADTAFLLAALLQSTVPVISNAFCHRMYFNRRAHTHNNPQKIFFQCIIWCWLQRQNETKRAVQEREREIKVRTNILLSVQCASHSCMNEASTPIAMKRKIKLKNRERDRSTRSMNSNCNGRVHRIFFLSLFLLVSIIPSRYCSDLSEICNVSHWSSHV